MPFLVYYSFKMHRFIFSQLALTVVSEIYANTEILTYYKKVSQQKKPKPFQNIPVTPQTDTGNGGLPFESPYFLNVYGAQELIPRNEFRQPM